MKRFKFTRRALDARMPGPVYRDVHPDREPMALYDSDGNVTIQSDLPRSLMRKLRRVAMAERVSPAELLVTILQKHVDKHQRGF